MAGFQKFTDKIMDKAFLRFIPKHITPNQVTMLRFISLPFIYYLLIHERYGWGLVIFSLSALTDAIDGAMARIRRRITEEGKTWDPIADKALILVVALTFIPRYFGWWLLAVIIVLELLNFATAQAVKKRLGRNPGSNWAGKVKMIIQSIAFIFIFIGVLTLAPLWITAAKWLLYTSAAFLFLQIFFYPRSKR